MLLPGGIALRLGFNLTVGPQALSAALRPGAAPYCTLRSVSLSPPLLAAAPVVVLTGVHVVPPCESATTVSAEYSTGGGAFGLEYTWAAAASGAAPDGAAADPISPAALQALQAHLASLSPTRASRIVIQTDLLPLPPSVTHLKARASSVLGMASEWMTLELSRLESPLPVVQVSGSSQVQRPL